MKIDSRGIIDLADWSLAATIIVAMIILSSDS